MGVMFLRKPKSLGRYDSFGGVITGKRMIFAQITSEMLKDAINMARDKAKAEGKGFFEQWADQLSASFGYVQKYLTMEPSAILSETPGNFDIDNSSIREIKLTRKDISQGNKKIKKYEFELEIKSSQGKYAFRMDDKDEYVKSMTDVQLRQMQSTWMKYFIVYDPAPALEKVTCPVLMLFGELDLQVPPSQNKEPMENALQKGGNRDFKTIIFPKANHLFLSTETGNPGEYPTLPKEFVPGFLETMKDWIAARVTIVK